MPEPHVPDLLVLMLDKNESELLGELIVTCHGSLSSAKQKLALSLWERLSEDTVSP